MMPEFCGWPIPALYRRTTAPYLPEISQALIAELRDDVIAGEFSLKVGSEDLTMLSNSAMASSHRPLWMTKNKQEHKERAGEITKIIKQLKNEK